MRNCKKCINNPENCPKALSLWNTNIHCKSRVESFKDIQDKLVRYMNGAKPSYLDIDMGEIMGIYTVLTKFISNNSTKIKTENVADDLLMVSNMINILKSSNIYCTNFNEFLKVSTYIFDSAPRFDITLNDSLVIVHDMIYDNTIYRYDIKAFKDFIDTINEYPTGHLFSLDEIRDMGFVIDKHGKMTILPKVIDADIVNKGDK